MSDTRTIPLSKGLVATVSSTDYPRLSLFRWHAACRESTGGFYAARHIVIDGQWTTVPMAREILGLIAGDPRQADHQDHDELNNTRENLRIATRSENCRNRRIRVDNTSTFKGVSWNPAGSRIKPWRVQLGIDGKNLYLGRYADPRQAALVYDARARQEFGAFAYTNFPADATFALPVAA